MLGLEWQCKKAAEATGNGKRLLVVRLNCLCRKESRHSNQIRFFSPLASCIMFSQGVPMPVQNGGQQSFAQLVRSQGQTYQPMQMQPAAPMMTMQATPQVSPSMTLMQSSSQAMGPMTMSPMVVNQADIMAFKKNIPTTAGVEFGVGLQVTGYQRELLGLQQFRSFNTRSGMNTNISFSPEGILGTAHFDPSTWCAPTVTRIVATAVDASWASHLAADRMRLVPIPTHGYDMFKSIFPLLPWDADEKMQRAFVTEIEKLSKANNVPEKPFPEAPRPMPQSQMNAPTTGSASSSEAAMALKMEELQKQLAALTEKLAISPPRKEPRQEQK